MSNLLFVVGPEGTNNYEDCREFVNKYALGDLIVIDVQKLFERLHYKEKVGEDFQSWFATFSPEELSKIVTSCLNARIAEMGETVSNVIVTGNLTLDQCKTIRQGTSFDNTNILFVDATPQVLYRNLSLNSKTEIDVQEFLLKLQQSYNAQFSSIIAFAKRQNTFFYKHAANSSFDGLLMEALGYSQTQKQFAAAESYIWPVTPKYTVTQHDFYGERPIHIILGKPKFHSGFDITATTLTPVQAATEGVVVHAGIDERILSGQAKWNQRYGNVVELVDNFGRRQIYAHLRKALVKEGTVLKQGQILGLSGCSGGARTPHLHFEVRGFNVDHSGKENTIDPLQLLPEMDLHSLDAKLEEKPYAPVWEKLVETPFGLTDKDVPYSNSREFIR